MQVDTLILLEINLNHTVKVLALAKRKVENSNARVLCIFNESYGNIGCPVFMLNDTYTFVLWLILLVLSYQPDNHKIGFDLKLHGRFSLSMEVKAKVS